MARRRKSKTTRRRKTKISITGTAQGLIVANAMVKGASNANLLQFFTGRTPSAGYTDSYYQPSTSDSVITLPELLGIDSSSSKGISTRTGATYTRGGRSVEAGLQLETMKENVMENWPTMLGTAVIVPVAFKLGKRVMSKAGVSRGVNKVFDVAGLKEVRF